MLKGLLHYFSASPTNLFIFREGGLPEGSSTGDSDVQFKAMLRNMGKASRKKFDQLAGLFSKRKRSGFLGKGASGDGSLVANPNRNSRDFLIRDDEYREFENDDTSGSERADSPFNRRPNNASGTLPRRSSNNEGSR